MKENTHSMFETAFCNVCSFAAHPAVQFGIIAISAMAQASAVMDRQRNGLQPPIVE